MAKQILMPQRERRTENSNKDFTKFLSILGGGIGMIAGAKAGGAGGAISGAGAGMSVGSQLGNFVAPDDSQAYKINTPGVDTEPGSSAVARRLEASRQDRLAVLRQAEAALPQLPQDLREQYAPVVVQAVMEEERRRQQMGGMA